MANILIYSDWRCQSSTAISQAILERLSEQQIELLVLGEPSAHWLNNFSNSAIQQIHILRQMDGTHYSPDACLHAVHHFIAGRDYDLVIAPATSRARDIFPGLSILSDSGLASELLDFSFSEDGFVGSKLLYGGQCLVDVELLGAKPWFATVHSSVARGQVTKCYAKAEINYLPAAPVRPRLRVDHLLHSQSERPALASADIIVAGGRGLRQPDNMRLLEQLADSLAAGLGASLGAVESQYASRDMLIGQSGSQIDASLYIACGISGAVQHMAGVRNAKKILAVNTDVNAPMMRSADYAIVGDLNEVIPEMIAWLKRKRAEQQDEV